ncbi:MAG: primosomal protein N' [Deltaproteobacteria bacterium]|nr:primosomal protein N' [Deltaproteobacteria bacterium]MBI2500616.1 primosomal protein N' [Deltaproteobacteria bacterium]
MLVDVVLPYRIPHPLTYELSITQEAKPGVRLLVPLGRQTVIGCLLGESQSIHQRGLKQVYSLLDDEPLLTPIQIKLLRWASYYYLTPIGEVLRHLLPPSFLKMKKRGRRARPTPPEENSFQEIKPVKLTPEQQAVLAKIVALPATPFLLQGVTGSGKTEIYIHLLQKAWKENRSALILVPEISMTPQLLGRLQGALPGPVVPYHSGLTEAQRVQVWEKVRCGEIRLVLGTRSAIFLPFTTLGLIVVDEEHDSSYKQEERFCYHARDLALWRGKEEEATVILGSATPSLESIYRVRQKKLTLLSLPHRPCGMSPPHIRVIDRRLRENRGHFLSEELRQELQENLKKEEQSLLFLNRRGFAPYVSCSRCGYIALCDSCDMTLTFHKKEATLRCHYCDAKQPLPSRCPRCKELPLKQEGIGTERLEEEVGSLFPKARIGRLDRDTAQGDATRKILTRMKERHLDILIGTQIVSKGHDYPYLSLVGILNTDSILSLPDFRAAERSFQLLTQVAGRSGRSERPGRVLIQTFNPEHPVMITCTQQKIDPWIETELAHRQKGLYPPFCRLIRIILYGRNGGAVERTIRTIKNRLENLSLIKDSTDHRVLGPSPCPLERIRNKVRWHLLIKSRSFFKLHRELEPFLDEVSRRILPSTVRMLVDVDPQQMM